MVDFRCEKCGKLLSVDAEAGTSFRCPQCRARLLVPAGLASLPKPQIAGHVPAESREVAEDSFDKHSQHEGKMFGVLAYGMPWVISVFMHVGIFLMAMFVVFIVAAAQPKRIDMLIPDTTLNPENPGGLMNPGIGGDVNKPAASPIKSTSPGFSRVEFKPVANLGNTSGDNILIGLAVGTGPGAGSDGCGALKEGLDGGGSGVGPKCNLWGNGGNAYQVVYVIDRSGSMINTFDYLRREMLASISRLKDSQDFHVIFYARGTPTENPPKQLIPANRDNRIMAAKFLGTIVPESQTDPLPALKRAFDVLQGARKTGKLVYLLSDGLFPDNSAVLRLIAERNPEGSGQAMICTFLYGDRTREAEEVMQKIAKENKGRYKYVRPDEE